MTDCTIEPFGTEGMFAGSVKLLETLSVLLGCIEVFNCCSSIKVLVRHQILLAFEVDPAFS